MGEKIPLILRTDRILFRGTVDDDAKKIRSERLIKKPETTVAALGQGNARQRSRLCTIYRDVTGRTRCAVGPRGRAEQPGVAWHIDILLIRNYHDDVRTPSNFSACLCHAYHPGARARATDSTTEYSNSVLVWIPLQRARWRTHVTSVQRYGQPSETRLKTQDSGLRTSLVASLESSNI